MKRLLFIGVYFFFVFALSAQNNEISTSQIVDLGLSVKWAGWNVGATSPEKYGKLYGWADPTGLKSSDNLDDYPSANPPTDIAGTSYDIARVQWGGDWRLPTKSEMEELVYKCKWTHTIYRNVRGFKVTGPNGNSIFMPLTGSGPKSGASRGFGITGNYWTSNLSVRDKTKAYGLYFSVSHGPADSLWESKRYSGKSVRPVMGISNLADTKVAKENTKVLNETARVSPGIQMNEDNPYLDRTVCNVKFDKSYVELKPFNVGETRSFVYHFTNMGDSTLIILRKLSSCPCAKFGKVTERVEPGKTGIIEILFGGEGIKEGYYRATMSIVTNFSKRIISVMSLDTYIAPQGMDPKEYVKNKKEQEMKEIKGRSERIRQQKIKEYEEQKKNKQQ